SSSPVSTTLRRRPSATLCPYTTLFRSHPLLRPPAAARAHGADLRLREGRRTGVRRPHPLGGRRRTRAAHRPRRGDGARPRDHPRSEEHTSELQSRENLVCRLLLEKKQN